MKKVWLSSAALLFVGAVALSFGTVASPEGRALSTSEMALATGGLMCDAKEPWPGCTAFNCGVIGNPQTCESAQTFEIVPVSDHWECTVGGCQWGGAITSCKYYECDWTGSSCIRGDLDRTDMDFKCIN